MCKNCKRFGYLITNYHPLHEILNRLADPSSDVPDLKSPPSYKGSLTMQDYTLWPIHSLYTVKCGFTDLCIIMYVYYPYLKTRFVVVYLLELV